MCSLVNIYKVAFNMQLYSGNVNVQAKKTLPEERFISNRS